MTELFGYTQKGLFQEIVERGKNSGTFTEEGFRELAEEVIEEHRSLGEINDDDPTEGLENWMNEFWPQYLEEMGISSDIEEVIIS